MNSNRRTYVGCDLPSPSPQWTSVISGPSRYTGDTSRFFTFQPIFKFNRETLGSEVLFRTGWDDCFAADPDIATRTMIDNWLLYGLDELAGKAAIFINCTRETLLSGLLPLLPRNAVLEILEDVEPDPEVIAACRMLKGMGFRISLDDFTEPEKMTRLVDLADFVKIDFRTSTKTERSLMVNQLRQRNVELIAEKIESEAEFCMAVREGFGLFQGNFFREKTMFMKTRDRINPDHCCRMLDLLLLPDFQVDDLAEWVDLEPGIECRLMRRATWIASPGPPINSVREALVLVGRAEFESLVLLAMTTQ